MSRRTFTPASAAFILWAALIFLCYGKNFPFSGSFENFPLDEILSSIVLVFVSLLSGNRLLKSFRLEGIHCLEEMLFSIAIGLALISAFIFLLGLLHLLYLQAVLLLVLGFCLLAASNHVYGRTLWERAKKYHPALSLPEIFMVLLVLAFAGLTLINTLPPPVSRDALIHHLAIPKLYMKHHGIVDIPFSLPSYYPPFMEMLYTGALILSSDILAKILHFLFYLGSLLFTFVLGRQFLSRFMSLLAVSLFGSLPVVFQVSSIAYTDLGLTFFTLGGFIALFRWSQTHVTGWFYLGALMTGWAVGCKYNGLIVFFILLMGIILILSQRKVSFPLLVKNVTVFIFLILMVNILWLARNYSFTGNPGYPLANAIIGEPWLPDQPKLSQYQIRRVLYGETLWDQILLPWNLSVKTKSKARYELDGIINPIFLIFLPFFIGLSGKPKGIKWLACFCLLYFLFFWASSRVRLRYLMPIYPLLGIITAYTVATWELRWKKIFLTIPLCLIFLLNLYWILVYTSATKPIGFLVGKESRRSFLCRHIPSYPVFEFINSSLPHNARIMFLYGGKHGNDGYYLDRDYFFTTRYMGHTGRKILEKVDTPEGVRNELLRMRLTHLLINWKRLDMDYASSLSPEKFSLFKEFCRDFLRLECKYGGSSLYRLL